MIDELANWFAARGEAVDVELRSRPTAGLANETVVVRAGGADLVLRIPPASPIFPDYDLRMQHEVQRALAGVGLPVPEPVAFEDDVRWLGRPFLLMRFVPGHVGAQVPALDEWLTSATADEQAALYDGFLDVVAAVHRFDWSSAGLAPVLREASTTNDLDWWRRYVEWSGVRSAALEAGLAWCGDHRPSVEPPPSLLWGDVRLGNVIFDEHTREVRAVLDWEMAAVGPAESDLGWLLGLDAVIDAVVGTRVEGFPPRGEVVARHERALGRPLVDLPWFETFALVRAAAVDLRQRALAGQPVADEHHPVLQAVAARIA